MYAAGLGECLPWALQQLTVRSDAGDHLARVLAPWLRVNGALTSLNLAGNKLGAEGGRAIADALKVADDLQAGHDRAQIAPERLTQCQQPKAHGLDLGFQMVDRSVGFADPLGERLVTPVYGSHGGFTLAFDKAAHLGDLGLEGLEILVERADYVVVCTH